MLDTWKQTALSDTVASQLVCHDHPRHILQPCQQPPEEALGSIGIAPVLNKDVEHNAVLIHGTPEIVLHALDPDEHLVEMPLVPRSRTPAAQVVGKALAEFPAPAPHSLIGDTTPRSARSSSTSRRLRLNTRYSQTAWLMISAENRWRYCGSGGSFMPSLLSVSHQAARTYYRDNALSQSDADHARTPRSDPTPPRRRPQHGTADRSQYSASATPQLRPTGQNRCAEALAMSARGSCCACSEGWRFVHRVRTGITAFVNSAAPPEPVGPRRGWLFKQGRSASSYRSCTRARCCRRRSWPVRAQAPLPGSPSGSSSIGETSTRCVDSPSPTSCCPRR
jgi:hypothetical protein